jgi:hypothetical protein
MGKSKQRKGVAAVGYAPSLNFVAALVAVAGIFAPFATTSPVLFVDDARAMLGAAGATLSASVPPNPHNTVAEQLANEKRSLDEREAMLDARENAPVGVSAGEIFGFAGFAISVVLLILIGVNFYLDSRLGRKPTVLSRKFVVDLR